MLERRSAIVELVNRKGNVSFAQLKEAFSCVSEMTLRTDLKALDQERRLIRVHGGARSIHVAAGTDDWLSLRAARNTEAKQIIAQKALQLLHPNITFFLDSGSTATILARCIPDQPCLIYTTGLSCAVELAKLTQAQIHLPGGQLNRFSMSVCGSRSIDGLRRVNFDLMFLGVTSFSLESGFSCGVEEESLLKQAVLERSERVAVLLDSSKLGLRSSFTICGLEDVDFILSDGGLPDSFLQECQRKNVQVF